MLIRRLLLAIGCTSLLLLLAACTLLNPAENQTDAPATAVPATPATLFTPSAQNTPTLTIDHAQGEPCSFLVVQGTVFPPDEALTLTINGYTFTTTVSVDNNGLLTFELDTTQAESGYYTVTASGNKPASVTFVLDLGAPVYPTQGNTLVFVVPGGLALTHQDYLPVVGR